jgi:hypothetical protein
MWATRSFKVCQSFKQMNATECRVIAYIEGCYRDKDGIIMNISWAYRLDTIGM